ncbi:putative leucine-rich repeat-containing protein DDB_G0290503 [Planococcus citri]|uniref:putative leucine-rich repeat-containing protein DDB_G0290503 n=1 Tax=Planococcus citri TaxID=170843 RepID=UPI0031F72F8B
MYVHSIVYVRLSFVARRSNSVTGSFVPPIYVLHLEIIRITRKFKTKTKTSQGKQSIVELKDMHSKSYLHFIIFLGFLSISVHGFHVNNSDTHSISGSIRSPDLPENTSDSLSESFIELIKQLTGIQVYLETKTRDMEKRDIELSRKEKEAEKRENGIKSLEQLLKQKEEYINKTAETLNKTDSQIKLREVKVKQKENIINKQKTDENLLKKREAEVNQKEDTINKKETEVKNNEQLLRTREKQLNEKENELEKSNADVRKQIEQWKQKEENIEKTEAEIKKREEILKRQEEILRQKENKTCSVYWVRAFKGNKPANALVGGQRGSDTLYVGRANHNGSLIPGYVLNSYIYIVDYGREHSYHSGSYEVATFDEKNICRIFWVKTSNGSVPAKAIVGGYDSHGENLYIGRAIDSRYLVIGKVQPSRHCLITKYSSSSSREQCHAKYEVAVIQETDENLLKKQEAEVNQKEDTINKTETEVKNNEQLLRTREKQLNEKENELEKSNASVRKQIQQLKQKEETIEKTETEIKKREEILKTQEEILRQKENKTCSVSWVRASDGNEPANALVGGQYGRTTLYVGRANHNGFLIPGSILQIMAMYIHTTMTIMKLLHLMKKICVESFGSMHPMVVSLQTQL